MRPGGARPKPKALVISLHVRHASSATRRSPLLTIVYVASVPSSRARLSARAPCLPPSAPRGTGAAPKFSRTLRHLLLAPPITRARPSHGGGDAREERKARVISRAAGAPNATTPPRASTSPDDAEPTRPRRGRLVGPRAPRASLPPSRATRRAAARRSKSPARRDLNSILASAASTGSPAEDDADRAVVPPAAVVAAAFAAAPLRDDCRARAAAGGVHAIAGERASRISPRERCRCRILRCRRGGTAGRVLDRIWTRREGGWHAKALAARSLEAGNRDASGWDAARTKISAAAADASAADRAASRSSWVVLARTSAAQPPPAVRQHPRARSSGNLSAPDAAVARWASARETSASAEDEAAESRASVRKATSFASARTASITRALAEGPRLRARLRAHRLETKRRPRRARGRDTRRRHEKQRERRRRGGGETRARARANASRAWVRRVGRGWTPCVAVWRGAAAMDCREASEGQGKTAARLAPQLSTPVDFVMTTVPARREFLESRTARYSIRPEHVESAPVLPTFCQPGVAV